MRVNANAPEKAAAPLPEVDVATVVPQTVTDWQSYSGRLEAVEKVDVRPQVSGTIVAVNFKDGALVKKGDVLFVIDPRPYRPKPIARPRSSRRRRHATATRRPTGSARG